MIDRRKVIKAGVAGMALLWTGAARSQGKEIVLNMLRPWPQQSNDCAGYREFMRIVNTVGKGKVQVKDLGGDEVFPIREQLSVLRLGKADLLFTSSGYITSNFPEPSALIYSFGKTPTEVRSAGITQRLDAIGREKAGTAFLGIPSWANAHIWLKEPIKSINDLRSRKLRSHPSYDPIVKGLGVSTVNIPFSELFTALDRGVVDGIAYPYYDLKTYGLEKVLKYRVDPPFWRAGWVIMLANAKQFDNLPKDVQQILLNAVQEVEKKTPELYDALALTEAKELAAAGVKSIKLPESEWLSVQKVAWEQGLPDTLVKVSPKYGPEIVAAMKSFYPPKGVFKAIGL
jgi:TRAP-type C4-dicarboxylate transport system substrate-binding protein